MDYNKIWSLINKGALSKRFMAKSTGMSPFGFNKMLENKTMKVETLEKIAAHFELPVSYFFDIEKESENAEEPIIKEYACLNCIEKQKNIDGLIKEIDFLKEIIKSKEEALSIYRENSNLKRLPTGKNSKAG